MNLKKYKKVILNGLILLLLIIITVYYLLHGQDLDMLIKYMKRADNTYLTLGFLMVLLYIVSESAIIHYLLNSIAYRVKILTCIKYSFVGFFVSAVTPGASGGQPAQMYYMKQDGISVGVSSLVLMVVTVAYKFVLLFLSLIMLLTEHDFVVSHVGSIRFLLILGILLNVVIVAFLLFVIYNTSYAKKIVGNLMIRMGKRGMIKNYHQKVKKILAFIGRYDTAAKYLKKNKTVFLKVFILTIIQRLLLFYVTYLVYRSFGLHGTSAYQIVTLQTLIALTVDNLPLPGGMGATEGIFIIFFKNIFTEELLIPGLILSRGLSYYTIIILGVLVTIGAHLTRNNGKIKVKKLMGDRK